jgi:hypothetical protein
MRPITLQSNVDGYMKKIILLSMLLLFSVSGCARLIRNLDAPAWSPPTRFQKAVTLPPLEIHPELAKNTSSTQPKVTKKP